MIIASIDPGISTGIVVYDTRCEILVFVTVATEGVLSTLAGLCLNHPFDTMLVEQPPHNAVESYIRIYQDILEQYKSICTIHTIFPGAWKPIAKANDWRFVFGKSTHEQDAYNMLRFWYLQQYKVDLGDGRKT